MEGRLLPVYTLTTGITNNLMTKTIRQALDDEALLLDYIPKEIRHQYQLCEYNYAIKEIHFPDEMDSLIEARRRLVFDEFLISFWVCNIRKSGKIVKRMHLILKMINLYGI